MTTNDKLDKYLKEAVVVYSEVLSRHLPGKGGDSGKPRMISIWAPDVRAEIRAELLPNTRLQGYSYSIVLVEKRCIALSVKLGISFC
jgi:hypothetical protein